MYSVLFLTCKDEAGAPQPAGNTLFSFNATKLHFPPDRLTFSTICKEKKKKKTLLGQAEF